MSTRDCGLDPQDSLSCNFLSAREYSEASLELDYRSYLSLIEGTGSVLLPEDSVGQLNDSSRQIYSIVFTLILIHSITQMEIFTKIFLLCNKNHWGSILFAQIIQKDKVFSKSASLAGNDVNKWQMKYFQIFGPEYFP